MYGVLGWSEKHKQYGTMRQTIAGPDFTLPSQGRAGRRSTGRAKALEVHHGVALWHSKLRKPDSGQFVVCNFDRLGNSLTLEADTSMDVWIFVE